MEIPVITPVQLNADNATRESKALSFDADAFLRIGHLRDENREPEAEDSDGNRLCSLWVEKWRQGPRWYRVAAVLNGGRMTFQEAPPDQAHRAQRPAAPAGARKRDWSTRRAGD